MPWSSSSVTRLALAALAAPVAIVAPAAATPSTTAVDWPAFAARFVAPDGRVIDTGNGGISHSEGQAYAMLLAEAAGDRAAFDKMWAWTDANLARRDVRLFSWRFDPAKGAVTDPNNATDGDLMLAWALYRAGKRWNVPAYLTASKAIRDAILARLVVRFGGRVLLVPGMQGFVRDDSVTVNTSYFVFPALDLFARLEPKSGWREVRDESLRLTRDGLFGANDLPVDWMRVDRAGRLWSEPDRPPNFGFDAVRVPLYLIWSRRTNDMALAGIRRWWATARLPNGQVPATVDVVNGSTSTFGASAGLRRVIDLTLNGRIDASPPPADQDYYSTALWALTGLSTSVER